MIPGDLSIVTCNKIILAKQLEASVRFLPFSCRVWERADWRVSSSELTTELAPRATCVQVLEICNIWHVQISSLSILIGSSSSRSNVGVQWIEVLCLKQRFLHWGWGWRFLLPENSQHWTTSRRWSIAGWTRFRWGRGSCTWSRSQCHHCHRCGKPGSLRPDQRSTLRSARHSRRRCLGGWRRWGSPPRGRRGCFVLEGERKVITWNQRLDVLGTCNSFTVRKWRQVWEVTLVLRVLT